MEHERRKKRGRDREEAEREEESSNKSRKMQADHHPSHPRSTVRNDNIQTERRSCEHEEDSNTSNEISGDNNFAGGVFDFPWLKEGGGMISKADEEEWCLEDTVFSSSLHYGATSAADPFSGQQHLWETTTCIGSCMDVPVGKFEEINAWSLEMEEISTVAVD